MAKTKTTKIKTAGRVITVVRDASGRIIKTSSEPARPSKKTRYPFEKRGQYR
jgi:hypothetical protein